MFGAPAAVQQAQRAAPAPLVQQAMPAPRPILSPTPVQEANPVQQAKPNTTLADFRDESVGIDMVFVKGGTFMMGCTDERECGNNEKPPRMVTLSGFYIGKYEITQKQWVQVMGSNPSYFGGDDMPVEKVSWNDILTFILRLNSITGKRYRLPTEAEWEYAARGGTNSGYKYSGGNAIGVVGWYSGNSDEKTNPVGGKQPNEFGIYDMTGNVAEWVSDYYDTYAFSNVTANPKGPVSGVYRTVRGGSYYHFTKNCRVSYRGGNKPDVRRSSVGFRLALDAQDTGPVQLSQTQQDYPQDGYTQRSAHVDFSLGYTQRSAYVDFSLGERWGTWFFNALLPGWGLGSHIIMQDAAGGITQSVLTGGGILFIVLGVSADAPVMSVIGLLSISTSGVYSIVRSATYHKKMPQNAASLETPGLQWAILPDQNGDVKAYMAYTMEF
jgi:formylglycine-generating enzyme required for sulfatase activity